MNRRSLVIALLALGLALPLGAQNAPGTYTASDVERGAGLYGGQCVICHGATGDTVSSVDLRRGRFSRPLSDDDLRGIITSGRSTAGMPAFALNDSELNGLVAFIRAGLDVRGSAARVGRAESGQAIFDGKGGCGSCHRVNGKGPRGAPDLSDIGAGRSASALQRSLIDPTAAMWPINRPVRIVTRDGRTIRGRRLNEDTFTVQLLDDQERLVSLSKSDIREYEVSKTSPMPSMADKLTTAEIADVVAYLLSLRGL